VEVSPWRRSGYGTFAISALRNSILHKMPGYPEKPCFRSRELRLGAQLNIFVVQAATLFHAKFMDEAFDSMRRLWGFRLAGHVSLGTHAPRIRGAGHSLITDQRARWGRSCHCFKNGVPVFTILSASPGPYCAQSGGSNWPSTREHCFKIFSLHPHLM
jgi:hypothetical protein